MLIGSCTIGSNLSDLPGVKIMPVHWQLLTRITRPKKGGQGRINYRDVLKSHTQTKYISPLLYFNNALKSTKFVFLRQIWWHCGFFCRGGQNTNDIAVACAEVHAMALMKHCPEISLELSPLKVVVASGRKAVLNVTSLGSEPHQHTMQNSKYDEQLVDPYLGGHGERLHTYFSAHNIVILNPASGYDSSFCPLAQHEITEVITGPWWLLLTFSWTCLQACAGTMALPMRECYR